MDILNGRNRGRLELTMNTVLLLLALLGLYLLVRGLFDWARFHAHLRQLYRQTPWFQNSRQARYLIVAVGIGLGVLLPLGLWSPLAEWTR